VVKDARSFDGSLLARDVATRGARIRFVEGGIGPALVLLHDSMANHETFGAALAHLAGSFRVIAPDLPGFGGSEKPSPQRYHYGYDGFAESVFDLIAALGLGRVHVCGHGMGAGVALTLAARHAAVVHRLVVVDAAIFSADEHVLHALARVPLVGGLLWRQVMGYALFKAYVQGTVYAGAGTIPAGRVESMYASFNAPAARQAAQATLAGTADTRPLVARLPRIAADTLVVWGRDDRLAPVEHGRRLARELRGRFEVFECGRCPPDERPEEFAATLSSFLAPPATESRKSAPHRLASRTS
jgi:pimeloyl-ACP methyl ester carboxylesterase